MIIGQIKSGKFSGREGGLSICDIFWVQRRKEGMGGGSLAFVTRFRFKITLDYRSKSRREGEGLEHLWHFLGSKSQQKTRKHARGRLSWRGGELEPLQGRGF